MKIINLNARDSKELKFEPKDNNAVERGITRRLLEKYKPKHHYKPEAMRETNKRQTVA